MHRRADETVLPKSRLRKWFYSAAGALILLFGAVLKERTGAKERFFAKTGKIRSATGLQGEPKCGFAGASRVKWARFSFGAARSARSPPIRPKNGMDYHPWSKARTMECSAPIEQVRQTVITEFTALGLPENEAGRIQETVLLRERFYAGRRFSCRAFSAVWLAGSAEISFYGDDGQVLHTTTVPAESASRAA